MSTGGKRARRTPGETAADGGNGGHAIAGTIEDAMGVEDPPPLQPQEPTEHIPGGCEDVMGHDEAPAGGYPSDNEDKDAPGEILYDRGDGEPGAAADDDEEDAGDDLLADPGLEAAIAAAISKIRADKSHGGRSAPRRFQSVSRLPVVQMEVDPGRKAKAKTTVVWNNLVRRLQRWPMLGLLLE